MSERRSRPNDCEFPPEVKLEALRRADFTCEGCGKKKLECNPPYLEIHHRLGIAIALHHYPEICHTLLASVANARCYCKSCHDIADREDPKYHKQYYEELTSMYVRQLQLELSFEEKPPATV